MVTVTKTQITNDPFLRKKMIVERKNNEIIVRIPADIGNSRIQMILDYLRFEELTSKSNATIEDVENLVNEAKKGRWGKIKKEIGFDD